MGAKSRGPLSDAVRRQARWVNLFEKNLAAVSKLGIDRVLSREYYGKPTQKWLYRMRTRWDNHSADRKKLLLSLGQEGWWLRTDPARHQTRTGFLVGSAEHKRYKHSVGKRRRDRNRHRIRRYYREYYATHPNHRERVAAARQKRFEQNPGQAAYLRSLRRQREKAQRCNCCSNSDFRRVYLKNGSRGLQTDHKVSLAIAIEKGLQGTHCVSNLQGLTPEQHKKKTSADISKLAEICRLNKVAYHRTRRAE